jgi:hypothetical protein
MVDHYCGDPEELGDVPNKFDIREYCVKRQLISPVWAEFGVAGGDSARQFLQYLPEDGTFYLFDSFKGLPEPWWEGKKDSWASKGKPSFNDKRVVIKEGWFKDTLPLDDLLGFVHIDCDIYSSTKTVLDNINVDTGSIILFDELWGYERYRDHEFKALMEWDRPFRFVARNSRWRAAVEVL